MKKEKKTTEGLTFKKEENFSDWYPQLVQKAELADYSIIKGFMIIRPNAYSIWETIQGYFNKRLRKLGVRNAYFPLLVPESFFKKEAKHAEGFKPEVAWLANKYDSDEKLAIRPTSETVMYDSYSRWIRSWRDLPLRINQWANIVRWETKATRLFLRTREFLWQEGHCVYETEKECEKETLKFLNEYQKLCRDLLAIPVFKGKKSEKEKFAGAKTTYSIDTIMPDGRSLQCGTSHNLGQDFAASFNIHPLGRDGKRISPWQNSWGFSTRLIGALIMLHGDDRGLVLPPRVAYNKVVIVPIFNDKTKQRVLKEAEKIKSELKSYNPFLDNREGYSPGWKFNEWELKGIPVRIEIGPKDIAEKSVIAVKRNSGKKIKIKRARLKSTLSGILEEIQKELYEKAEKSIRRMIVRTESYSEVKKQIKNKKVSLSPLCNNKQCEENIKSETGGAGVINIPLNQLQLKNKKCIYCKKPAFYWTYIGKSY